MWNIRSHARRFPVHTGTLTPSIAHPNRFLNHLKRFSAGFLTFRGGKIKKCTVSGDKTNDFECAPGSWLVLSVKPCRACHLPHKGGFGSTVKFLGRPQSLRVRLLPLGGAVARSAAEGVIWVRTPSVKPCRACHLPHKGGFGSAVKFLGRPQSLRFRQSLSLWERCHRR